MWELVNRTRFAAERAFARERDGSEVLLVAVKASFTIGPDGSVRVADEQVPVERVPRHSGEPGLSSLVCDADLSLPKAATDVLLTGHARARNGKPTIALEARVRVGGWQKRILVVGDRRWDRRIAGWSLTDPEPFVSMPLVYERAFGGSFKSNAAVTEYPANPVGIGFGPPNGELDGAPAPNLEDPNDLLRAPSQRPAPMSFGAIAREWPERRRLAGTYDDRWKRQRRPLVPEDFDDTFWQSAPVDQRVRLEGGEPVELAGFDERGVVRFELPSVKLALRTRLGGKVVEHEPSLQTVLFEPDQLRVVLVLQSALPCHHDIQSLRRTEVTEIARAA